MSQIAKSRIVIGKPKIVEKNLRTAHGHAYPEEYKIELDKSKNSKCHLNSTCHELAHLILPDASETKIKQIATIFTKILWGLGYRRTKK